MQRMMSIALIVLCVLALPVFGATVGTEATGGHAPLLPLGIFAGLAGAFLALKAMMSDTTACGPTASVGAADYQALTDRDYHTIDWSNGTGTDVSPGQIVVVGNMPMWSPGQIANGASGTLVYLTTLKAKKTSASAFTQGDAVYWNTTGNPAVGTGGTGACTDNAAESGTTYLMGWAMKTAAAVSADRVEVSMSAAKRTATVAGSVTADDITGSDSALGIVGLPAAQGGSITATGGTSSTSANAGGAVALVGGTPGVTGTGGAVSATGGIGGSTSGSGGAASLVGGAGTLNATGGQAIVTGGAGNGSGGSGGVAISGGTPGVTGAGGGITVTAGPGGATSGAAGTLVMAGGAAASAAGNVVGGLASLTGGIGKGNLAGGAATLVGGVGGATGAGGAAGVTGGAGGATSGTGGNVNLTGGAGLGTSTNGGSATVAGGAGVATTGTGGAVAVTGGASPGASGTAGAVTVDAGAATGGTGAAVNIGTTNATAVNLGKASVATVIGGPVTESIGASTAALGTTYANAAGLPAGTASTYPVTAADDTVGVIIDAADKVTGRMLFIGNLVSNKILKVYGPSGATINGAGANVGFSSASGKGVIIQCLSSAGNTWMAW